MLDRQRNQRVTGFVICDTFFFDCAHHAVLLLQSEHHPVDGFLNVAHLDLFAVASRGKQCSFVDDISQVCARHSGRSCSDGPQVCAWAEFDLSRMNFEDGFTAVDVRPVDHDLPVEASGAQKRLIEDFGRVRGSHDDDA